MKLEEVARVRSTHGALPYPQQKIFDGRIFRLVELVPPPVSPAKDLSPGKLEIVMHRPRTPALLRRPLEPVCYDF
jgi:hypothetical protein